jgi:hypothetical protein
VARGRDNRASTAAQTNESFCYVSDSFIILSAARPFGP